MYSTCMCLVAQLCPVLCNPMDCSPPGPSIHGDSADKNTGVEKKKKEYWSGLPFLHPGDLPNPGIEPWSPTLQADSLPSEPLGKSTL